MIRLLRANFFKMFCSWSFWLTLMLLPFLNFFVILNYDKEFKGMFPESGLERWNIGQCGNSCFSHLMYLTYVIVLLVGMLIGDEYASGALRNKIIAGYSRIQLYVSYLIVSVCECLMVNLFSIGVSYAVCCFRYGYDGDAKTFMKMVLASIPPVAALTAFTLFCIIFAGERTSGMIIAFLSDLVIYFFVDGFFIRKLLLDSYALTELQKKAILCFDAMLPSSYVEWLYVFGAKAYYLDVTASPKCWWCCITLAAMIAAGLVMFRKTDLK